MLGVSERKVKWLLGMVHLLSVVTPASSRRSKGHAHGKQSLFDLFWSILFVLQQTILGLRFVCCRVLSVCSLRICTLPDSRRYVCE